MPMILAGSTCTYGTPIFASGSRIGIGSRCGGGGSSAMSVISRRRGECRWFTSMMIFFAEWSSVGDSPTEVVRNTRPSGVTSVASTTARSISPKKPNSSACGTCDRCMSTNSTAPLLIWARSFALDWYGARHEMASASARSSSSSPVDAPVITRILNGRPARCSSRARAASARGTSLAAPAGVKPLKPTVWPSLMCAAASSGVRRGKDMTDALL